MKRPIAWAAAGSLALVLAVEFYLMWAFTTGVRSAFELARLFVRALEAAGF